MTYEFAKYPDGTLGVFSNIGKKENDEEYIRITFERPTKDGFDTCNENDEPIHVNISKGSPIENATKVWITQTGGCIVCHNNC